VFNNFLLLQTTKRGAVLILERSFKLNITKV